MFQPVFLGDQWRQIINGFDGIAEERFLVGASSPFVHCHLPGFTQDS
jgi:hypothetical protein